MLEEFKTLFQIENYFTDEEVCTRYLENYRWENGTPTCPQCHKTDYYNIKSSKQYRCKYCRKNFTVKAGTLFDNSNVPLKKWFMAIFLLTNDRRSMSSVQMSEWLGITQKSAWFMNHRIRTMFIPKGFVMMTGIVQIDETYYGARKEKMSKKRKEAAVKGTGMIDKLPILTLLEQSTGRMICIPLSKNPNGEIIKPIIRKYVSTDATLITDGSGVYAGLDKEYAGHVIINHSNDEYVKDGYSTNEAEGSYKHLKDCLNATFKGRVSEWHMPKYVSEFANKRTISKSRKLKQEEGVRLSPNSIVGTLKYKDLINLNPNRLKMAS